jgi:hypothetical protein
MWVEQTEWRVIAIEHCSNQRSTFIANSWPWIEKHTLWVRDIEIEVIKWVIATTTECLLVRERVTTDTRWHA